MSKNGSSEVCEKNHIKEAQRIYNESEAAE